VTIAPPQVPVVPKVPAVPDPPTTLACPLCGKDVSPVLSNPETVPWVCTNFAVHRNGFWSAELSVPWDKRTRTPERAALPSLRPLVAKEQAEAIARGVSLRPDQLRLVGPRVIARLLALPGVDPIFVAQARSLGGA